MTVKGSMHPFLLRVLDWEPNQLPAILFRTLTQVNARAYRPFTLTEIPARLRRSMCVSKSGWFPITSRKSLISSPCESTLCAKIVLPPPKSTRRLSGKVHAPEEGLEEGLKAENGILKTSWNQ